MEVITSPFLTLNSLGKEGKEVYVEIKMKKKLRKFWKVIKIKLRAKKLKKQLKKQIKRLAILKSQKKQ